MLVSGTCPSTGEFATWDFNLSGFILGSATVVYPPPKKEKAEFFRAGFCGAKIGKANQKRQNG